MPSSPLLVALSISPTSSRLFWIVTLSRPVATRMFVPAVAARRAVPADDREAVHGHVGRVDRQRAELGRTGVEGDRRVEPTRRRLELHRVRASADADARGLTALVPLLEALAGSTAALRDADPAFTAAAADPQTLLNHDGHDDTTPQ